MPAEDELSPSYIGEKLITIARSDDAVGVVKARDRVTLTLDLTQCEPGGVEWPLKLTVSGPSASSYRTKLIRRPTTGIVVTPSEGGPHLVTVSELAHDRWWGSIKLDVQGPTLERSQVF